MMEGGADNGSTGKWDAVLCCCLLNFCVLYPSFISLQSLFGYALASVMDRRPECKLALAKGIYMYNRSSSTLLNSMHAGARPSIVDSSRLPCAVTSDY